MKECEYYDRLSLISALLSYQICSGPVRTDFYQENSSLGAGTVELGDKNLDHVLIARALYLRKL